MLDGQSSSEQRCLWSGGSEPHLGGMTVPDTDRRLREADTSALVTRGLPSQGERSPRNSARSPGGGQEVSPTCRVLASDSGQGVLTGVVGSKVLQHLPKERTAFGQGGTRLGTEPGAQDLGQNAVVGSVLQTRRYDRR